MSSQHGVINGVDVIAGVPDPSLPVLPTDAVEPPSSALPPGSICETCWDQPATQLLPAPWGGEMGSCVWCAAGEGEEAEAAAFPLAITVEEMRAYAQELLADAMQQNAAPAVLPSEGSYQFSSDGQTWHDQISDCTGGVRYVRAVYIAGSRQGEDRSPEVGIHIVL